MTAQEAKQHLERILKILESAKDKNGDVPMSIVRKAFDKLLPSAQPDLQPTCNNLQQVATDTISRLAAIDGLELYIDDKGIFKQDRWFVHGIRTAITHLRGMTSAQPDNHKVASLLAELFGDTCACNFNDIDEWLPDKCEFIDSCPNPGGVTCWEQFLKHRAERRADE